MFVKSVIGLVADVYNAYIYIHNAWKEVNNVM